MSIINGIRVYDLLGPDGEPGGDYLVPDWADRHAVAEGLMGMPARHPSNPDAFASGVTIRGVGPRREAGGRLAYASAVVAPQYAVPEYAI